jgi:CheY-like chemotaxis protein
MPFPAHHPIFPLKIFSASTHKSSMYFPGLIFWGKGCTEAVIEDRGVKKEKTLIPILFAEDDEDDFLLILDAMKQSGMQNRLFRVKDGEEALDFLLNRGDHSDPEQAPRPGIIFLDLNMPRKNGRSTLQDIKANPLIARIPVVVMTASDAEEDIKRSYDLGANTYIKKPDDFTQMVKIFESIKNYWFDIVELPLNAH